MRILLVEDEPLAQQRIKSIIKKNFPEWEVVDSVQSIKSLKEHLKNAGNFDMILCDIHLADGLSFRAFSEFPDIKVPVVFITAYDQYALQSFDHNCLDYVLKPIDENRLVKALQKASKYQEKESKSKLNQELIEKLLTIYQSKTYKKRFLTKLGNKFVFIPVENIAYFYSEDGLTFLVEGDSSTRYIIDHSLNELESDLLDPLKFYRINRSMIIHLDSLVEIKPYVNGRLELAMNAKAQETMVVARERVNEFKNWINQ
ncbi:LytR/AlgR family response regulator transcription factor [Algoriphagus limi]|uniref:LytTR family DNA-binding domain-containing protein n=1 Tax=Algoriphagus limi TaxID=2975273 RepID=A0ABT2G1I4_9BACT|nr:LytTR family DNA-binding domain-containing protein [Algoriphagus limi]MCS5489138.1 LytTR family DNA-binding domain-containing protein [Algoriphagus limi]